MCYSDTDNFDDYSIEINTALIFEDIDIVEEQQIEEENSKTKESNILFE
ncbi:MAG: hypothetical protein J6Y28_01690 [Acholeplasmatales bacterium]|nr:hypothetical protein [Methanobrevibacter sp.]MBP5444859.1 hypothetical protein [Acholeplasmatales bacterium]